jgi:hypothetical protein
MFPRTFLSAAFCALCVVRLSMAGTRIMVSAGAELSTEFTGLEETLPWHLNAALDAPPLIRKHVPVELVLGFTGPYPRERHWKTTPMGFSASVAYYHYQDWEPRSRFSESVRFYLVGHNTPTHAPDGMELAVGLGNHQLLSRLNDYAHIGESGWRVQSQWRVHMAFRTQFLPSHSSGPTMELELQRPLDNTGGFEVFWASTAIVTLGWRFRV